MSIPILHLTWKEYRKIHFRDHHAKKILCTDKDPDQQFMTAHGFYYGMTEEVFLLTLFSAPFHYKNIFGNIKFRIIHNFVKPNKLEILYRLIFWCSFIMFSIVFDLIFELLLLYFLPILVITQFASWFQHVTEHLWFSKKPKNVPSNIYYASLTWGRYLGRAYPNKENNLFHTFKILKWWVLIFIVDLPIKLFIFMQDLLSHDFHHRSPGVNFWHISSQRAAHENQPSVFGPMTETWGLFESFYILRDHIFYQKNDPFGIYLEYQNEETNYE